MSRSMIVAALVLACLALVKADEFSHSGVVNLDAETYEDAIADGKVYFIKYYAPWCGHCKRLVPIWNEMAESLKEEGKDNIVIAHVDCTVARDVCSNADVKGYPTLKVAHKGEILKVHKGPRDLSSLLSYIKDSAADVTTEL